MTSKRRPTPDPIGTTKGVREIRIAKGIPIPPKRSGQGRRGKHWAALLRRMKVGDSVLCLGWAEANSMRVAAMQDPRGFKLTQREVTNGIRVWRVA